MAEYMHIQLRSLLCVFFFSHRSFFCVKFPTLMIRDYESGQERNDMVSRWEGIWVWILVWNERTADTHCLAVTMIALRGHIDLLNGTVSFFSDTQVRSGLTVY